MHAFVPQFLFLKFVSVCLAASIIALAVTVVAFVLLLFHLPNKKMEQPKFKLYVASVVAVFIASKMHSN